jgi:ribosomal protein S27E
MTSQTKIFIELADIVGLRIECRKCGCSLLIGVESENENIHNLLSPQNYLLAKCPTCDSEWTHFSHAAAAHGSASFDSDIKKLFRILSEVRKIESKLGCALTLEIKNPKP